MMNEDKAQFMSIESTNGMRGFAALLIFFSHFSVYLFTGTLVIAFGGLGGG